jgi:hypothetical protein
VVQAFVSLQLEPSDLAGLEQAPVPGSHVPARWHWSDATHTTGVPAAHWPVPSQVSAPSQASPFEQLVPAETGV